MDLSAPEVPSEERTAVVIGRWGDDTALLRAADGSTLEVPVPRALRAEVDVGATVELVGDTVVNWHGVCESR
ncbi:MAG TPA: hypothetical protein VF545_01355 [Thermoleophilaceae bacterium]